MQKIWNHAPLIRLLLPFLAGVVLGLKGVLPLVPVQCTLALLISIIAFVVLLKIPISYSRSAYPGILIHVSFFLSGYLTCLIKKEILHPAHFSNLSPERTIFIRAVVKEPPVEKPRSFRIVLEATQIFNDGDWDPCEGKIMVHFAKDPRSAVLRYGDELLAVVDPREPALPPGVFDFDYRAFLANHNIFHQAYLRSGKWKATGRNNGNPLRRMAITARDKLLEVLRACELKGNELSVAAALMLGHTDLLDQDLLAAYSGTGALHVLSVSGLHVAIVYMIFNWMLGFLLRFRNGHIIRAGLLLMFLWCYAALTGLSPSVLRAATMFSFVIAGNTSKKHTNIYNTLAASAFLLLSCDPFLVKEVGFQLSYIAVVGIISLQPLIAGWFETENRLIEQTWNLLAVSLAAQLATFPLGLYYFHQFPNYFLLSNLIVIPLSTLIIYLGILVFSLSSIPLIIKYLSLAFSWMISLLNLSVTWMEGLPAAVLEGFSLNLTEVCLIYTLILFLVLFFTKKNYRFAFCSLCIIPILLAMQVGEQYQQQHQRFSAERNIKGKTVRSVISGRRAFILLPSNDIPKAEVIKKFKAEFWGRGVEQFQFLGPESISSGYPSSHVHRKRASGIP